MQIGCLFTLGSRNLSWKFDARRMLRPGILLQQGHNGTRSWTKLVLVACQGISPLVTLACLCFRRMATLREELSEVSSDALYTWMKHYCLLLSSKSCLILLTTREPDLCM
jgi:hypothetical protein